MAIHDWVREEIPFGWSMAFNHETPLETLTSGLGFCQTKSMLLAALLEAQGFGVRVIFAEIDAAVLRGLVSPGTPVLDHTFLELDLDGDVLSFDSYIVDRPLFLAAQDRCFRERKPLGYGVHAEGKIAFPGFCQFVDDGPTRGRIWGPFSSRHAFEASGAKVWNRLSWYTSLFWRPALVRGNWRVAALRRAGAGLL